MALSLYNDLTRKKEVFRPVNEGEVRFYSCGPTVYDFFHIGNARPFIVFDVLRRWLEYCGYRVLFVQNFTDIDDKIIDRANQMGIPMVELAERNIANYYEDADALGIKRATWNPRATQYVDKIIGLIETLIDKGHAYEVDGTVYFDVKSFPGYGKLSKQSIEDLQSGARIEVSEHKRSPLDFVLWKPKKEGEPSWPSPWGEGRPGWHIECSAMSMDLLGDTIDIHSGGIDLTFPHHENEIAQTEAATGEKFVNYWIHNEYILIDRAKMSKSMGNFLTARAAMEAYPPLAIRLFMLSAHYRSPVNFTDEGMKQSIAALNRIRNCYGDLMFAKENGRVSRDRQDGMASVVASLWEEFTQAMNDDFNTAEALGFVFETVTAVNTWLGKEGAISQTGFDAAEKFFGDLDEIMGIVGISKDEDILDDDIEKLIAERKEARASKDFKRSDEIRDLLASKGIILEDTPQGVKWKRKV